MKEEKLKRFAMDEAMFEAVFEKIEESFKRKKVDADVHVLASTTLSLYNLEDAKKIIGAYRDWAEGDKNVYKQVGL